MAARVAAELSKDGDVEVETSRGGMGEFSVTVDGQKIVDTNRFWYPSPSKVVAKIRERLVSDEA